jgi:uncharacterized small protein (DUF1192 family)
MTQNDPNRTASHMLHDELTAAMNAPMTNDIEINGDERPSHEDNRGDEDEFELDDEDDRPLPDSDEAIRALQDVAEAVDELEAEIARLRAELKTSNAERDEARKICCRLWQREDSAYITTAQLAEDQGWECLISVYSEIISLGSCPAPELGLEGTGTAKRRTAAALNLSCCGVIDSDTPFSHFPLCIQGPERACQDGVTAEDCAARCNPTHHPNETCAEEACNPLP